MKSKTFELFCFIIICTIIFAAAFFILKEDFDIIPIIEGEDDSEYVIHRTEKVPRENVTSFIIDDGKIYIFYDKTALVNVYGTDGSFKYGIQVATYSMNHGKIAIFDGKLYFKSRLSIIFIFQDDQLIESIDFDSSYEKYISISEMISEEQYPVDGAYNYQLTELSNDIIRKDTQEIVVDLPEKSYIARQLLLAGVFVTVLSNVGLKLFFDKKSSSKCSNFHGRRKHKPN